MAPILLTTPYEVGRYDGTETDMRGIYEWTLERCFTDPGVQAVCPGADRQEFLNNIEKLFWKRLKAVPDLRVYPELEGFADEIVEKQRGFADGAGLTFQESLLLTTPIEYIWRMAARAKFIKGGCSAAILTDGPDGPLASHNGDTLPQFFRPRVPWDAAIIVPRTGYRYGGYMNEKGLAIMCVGMPYYEEGEFSSEVFPVPVIELMNRFCATVDEAIELLTRYKGFWGPCASVLVDAQGNGAGIDKSNIRLGVRRPVNGVLCCTEGVFAEPTMATYLSEQRQAILGRLKCDDPAMAATYEQYYADTAVRYATFARLVSGVTVRDFAALARVVSHHGPHPQALCRHGGPDTASYDKTATCQHLIVAVDTRTWYWRHRKDGRPPCEQEWQSQHMEFGALVGG